MATSAAYHDERLLVAREESCLGNLFALSKLTRVGRAFCHVMTL